MSLGLWEYFFDWSVVSATSSGVIPTPAGHRRLITVTGNVTLLTDVRV
jgi:hypothetical protein